MISVYETCDNIIYSRKMTHDLLFYNDLFPKTKVKTSSHMTKTGSQYSETGWSCSKQNLRLPQDITKLVALEEWSAAYLYMCETNIEYKSMTAYTRDEFILLLLNTAP